MVHHRSFEQVCKSEHLSRSRFRENVGASAVLAPGGPFDTGLVLEHYRKPQRGFSASKLRKDKGRHELYGTGKDHYSLATVFATAGARSDCPWLCGRNRFSRLDSR